MSFKIGDKVRLAHKSPFHGYTYEKTLSEVGTIIGIRETDKAWVINFPSHEDFLAIDSDLALATVPGLTTPLRPKNTKVRIVTGRPPDKPKKPSTSPVPPPNISSRTDEIIRQWKLNKSLELEPLAADFYTLIDLQCDFPKEPKINKPLEKLTAKLADQFSAYLDMVIGGELRHARNNLIEGYNDQGTAECYSSIANVPLSKIGKDILYALEAYKDFSGRDGAWGQWKEIREELGIKALQAAKEIYCLDWLGGYGGASWANATAILMDYLNGTMTATAFVDTCFGLHHNNNIILDKVWQITLRLNRVLDYNLHNRLNDVAIYCSPKIKTLRRRFQK